MKFQADEIFDEMSANEIRAALPVRAKSFLEAVGVESVVKLIEAYGGRRVYVPKDYHPDHPLLALLGADEATKLSQGFAALGYYEVPRGTVLMSLVRAKKIRRLHKDGMTYRELSELFSISERYICKIVTANRPATEPRALKPRKARIADPRFAERNKAIMQLRNEGESVQEIARKLGLSRPAVKSVVRGCPQSSRTSVDRLARNKAVVNLRNSGESVHQLALKFNLSESTIYAILRDVQGVVSKSKNNLPSLNWGTHAR